MGTIDKPDDNDRTIIDILRRNARSSLRDIAKVVKMSPSSVRNRIERLVERGLIKRFTVDLDYRKMGYEIQVIVLITSRPGSSEEIYKALQSFTEIFKVYWTSGPANFVCIVRVQNMNELSQFMTGQLEKLKGVERVESMFLMPEPEMEKE
ncbi:MAG: Lrp/AsnC family transcriptional regulator [Candidatus Thorarchaeota archaeon]|nr:Lrp/AsnC family transcriptional regulator [Candidatus Thorarchaeota archaeon]MCK5239223.1 Lrp/AsnC family transcriptional regulator [Candidatus Thorarchaeota archaeon]